MAYVEKEMNIKLAFVEYKVTQPTENFAIPFEFVEAEQNLRVRLNGIDVEDLGYSFLVTNNITVQVTPAITDGTLSISRETDIDENLYKFTAGALFEARTMDKNFEQIRHSQQEVRGSFDSLEASTSARLDSFSDRVDNLNSEFITTQAVVSDLVTVSADTVSTANTALSTANAIDAKATQALADAATALSSATTALNTTNATDVKATQALTNSTGAIKSSNNLSDVASATLARANLGVMSSSEVETAIATSVSPNATETVAGRAKIATTAIAQAGVNDTDFLTAKKLRDALHATGEAPMSACRAWIVFAGDTLEVFKSFNVNSITRVATGRFKIIFQTPMPSRYFAVSGTTKQPVPDSFVSSVMLDAADAGLATEVIICTKSSVAEHYDYPIITMGVFA